MKLHAAVVSRPVCATFVPLVPAHNFTLSRAATPAAAAFLRLLLCVFCSAYKMPRLRPRLHFLFIPTHPPAVGMMET